MVLHPVRLEVLKMSILDFVKCAITKGLAKRADAEFRAESDKWASGSRIAANAPTSTEIRIPEGVDFARFPFLTFPMVSKSNATVDRETGEVFEEQRWYWIGNEGFGYVLEVIGIVTALIAEASNRVPSLPRLHFDISMLSPVPANNSNLDTGNDGHVLAKWKPLTKTGRKSKYPVELMWSAYLGVAGDRDGSHGTISLLQSGEVGKADCHFWIKKTRYSLYGRIKEGIFGLSRVTYSDDEIQDIWLYDWDRDK